MYHSNVPAVVGCKIHEDVVYSVRIPNTWTVLRVWLCVPH